MVQRSSWSSNSANIGPHRKPRPLAARYSSAGDVVAAEVEEVVDLVMGGEEALGLAS